MHYHEHFRSLAGRFSTYLLTFTCTKQKYCLCIKILKPKLFQMSPLHLPICGITLLFQVNLHVPPLKFQMNICFVCLGCSWSDKGVVSIFHAKRVILMMSVYSLVLAREGAVIGMPSPEMKNYNN